MNLRRSLFDHAAPRALRALTLVCNAEGDEGDGGGGGGGGDIRADIASAMNGGGAEGGAGDGAPAAFAYPQHWSADDRTLFDQVGDLNLRKQVVDRFGAMERGFQPKLSEHARLSKRYGGIEKTFAKMIEGLEGRGSSVEAYMTGIVNLETALMDADPAKRVGAIKRLAELYDVPVAEIRKAFGESAGAPNAGAQNGGQGNGGAPPAPDPTLLKPFDERLKKVEGHLTSQSAQQQTETLQRLEREIDTIKSEKDEEGNLLRPHFDAVEDDLIAMVQAQRAAGKQVTAEALKDLYDRAVWGREEFRADLIKARDAAAEKKRLAGAAQKSKNAQRAGASLPSNSSSPAGGDDDLSLRDTIRSAMEGARGKAA